MNKPDIKDIIGQKILVLDGGLGTMIQGYGLTEKDYRGERFADWPTPLAGCNDLLVLTAPHVLARIHEAYLLAGADIISTDSFNSNAISMADYGLEEYVYELNRAAASLARKAADEFTLKNPGKPRYVAGSIGPTGKTASMSANVNDPASREVTFDELAATYRDQVRGLIDGGADVLLIETIFDTLNAKAAVFAARSEDRRRGYRVPVMLSSTLADASGRTLSGQVVEAFYASLTHAEPLSIGLNCGFGARQLEPYLERLAAVSSFPVSAHPNAGLPNLMGGYDETPQMMAADVERYLQKGLVNIVGGCCGTTPAHIGAIARVAAKYEPRPLPEPAHTTVLSGLETLTVDRQANFINVGERSNVAGSAKFARLIREGNMEQALSVARDQVDAGAQIIDVCMDDGLIDGVRAMTGFLNLSISEPDISRVPLMIDSSSWEVLEAGLKCVQGKSIVNSISLKEGEQEFVRRAQLIRDYGAAAVVMLFDEKGQADTYERKIEVAERAYKILIRNGFPPEDIVFDPNVLAVATGIPEHDAYGEAFIRACAWIKEHLPYSKVSGGVSNLSFAFRGNNTVREAMHSVFLYHAIAAGMDMGIVNPALLQVYTDIEPKLLELTEEVVLNRRADATERLSEYAEALKNGPQSTAKTNDTTAWTDRPLEERISYAMKKGMTKHIAEDALEAYRLIGSPLKVIDDMLMPAMGEIGELFAEGKMFLPQIVKSARVMKKAVEALTPYIEQESVPGASAGKILIATVKGDVHDIGKNIVSVVMSCNGYRVEDLGVMVDTITIVDRAETLKADAIGLSGLISPSLGEMIKVVAELEKRGLRIPVIIGGATTSAMHTAVKIAPQYSGPVVHSRDASENITILNRLLGSRSGDFAREIREGQEKLRRLFDRQTRQDNSITLEEARANRLIKDPGQATPPLQTGLVTFKDFALCEAAKYIDWNFFFPAWGIKGRFPDLLDHPEKGEEARKLYDDALHMLERLEKELTLNGVAGVFPAVSEGDDIVVTAEDGSKVRFAQLRDRHRHEQGPNLSLADYVLPATPGVTDHICLFAVTSGIGLRDFSERLRGQGDDYSAIMAKLLADRLAEAFAEAVHDFVIGSMWKPGGQSPEQRGLRVAFGYPSCPDHSLKMEAFGVLNAEAATGMRLTENYMIDPEESICGIIFPGSGMKYFSVGRIDALQLEDYAARRGMTTEEIAAIIPQHLK